MAAAKAAKQRAPRRHWPLAEKRRIVELTLRAGVSVGTSLSQRKRPSQRATPSHLDQRTRFDYWAYPRGGRPRRSETFSAGLIYGEAVSVASK
jgi:hypothetical protein